MGLKRSAALAVMLAVVAACGPGGAAQPQPGKIDPQVSLSVEVCTEGEGRDTRVYFRNLNDFEWQAVSFSVSKGGRMYTLGEEPQSMQGGRQRPETWPPEATKAAVAFAEAGDFTFRPVGETRGSSHKAPLNRLTHLGFLDSATVKVELPYPLEWTGEVQPCS